MIRSALAPSIVFLVALAAPADALALARAAPAGTGSDAAACTANGLVPANALADSALLRGPWHVVAPCARLSGHLAHFTLDTAFGPLEADGVEMLAIRVDEMHVIAQLAQVQPLGLGWQAARDKTVDTGGEVARVLRHPIVSAKRVPMGLWRFIRGKYDSIARESRKLADDAADELTDADEAYDDFSLRPGVVPEHGERAPWWQRNGKRVNRYAMRHIGYPDVRRTWSRRLGVDPYTSNPILDTRMDALAWSALGGERAAKLAIATIGGGAGELMATSRELNDLVWDLPASGVSARNAQRLAAMDCGEIEVRRFLRNGRFSPTLQTAVVDALIELQPIEGCVDIIEIAAALENELEARYLVNALRMLSRREGTSLPETHFADEALDREANAIGVSDTLRDDDTGPLSDIARDDAGRAIAMSDAARDAAGKHPSLTIDIRDGRAAPSLSVDIANGHASGKRALMIFGTAPAFRDADGAITLPLAVDRLQWTRETRKFFDQRRLDVPRRTVLIAGDATPRARRALSDRGWRVVLHAPFPGAPPYTRDDVTSANRLADRR